VQISGCEGKGKLEKLLFLWGEKEGVAEGRKTKP
jgi:hypothetical protein